MAFNIDYSPAGLYMRQASTAGRGDRFLAQEALRRQAQQQDLAERQLEMQRAASEIQNAMALRQGNREDFKAAYMPIQDQRQLDLEMAKQQFLNQRNQESLQSRQQIAQGQQQNYADRTKAQQTNWQSQLEQASRLAGMTDKRMREMPGITAQARAGAAGAEREMKIRNLPNTFKALQSMGVGPSVMRAAVEEAYGGYHTPTNPR